MENPKECNHCNSTNIEFKEMMTFSYWYCHDCKEEVTGESKVDSSWADLQGSAISTSEDPDEEATDSLKKAYKEYDKMISNPRNFGSKLRHGIVNNPNGNSPLPGQVITFDDLREFSEKMLPFDNSSSSLLSVNKTPASSTTDCVTVDYQGLSDPASFEKNYERELKLRLPSDRKAEHFHHYYKDADNFNKNIITIAFTLNYSFTGNSNGNSFSLPSQIINWHNLYTFCTEFDPAHFVRVQKSPITGGAHVEVSYKDLPNPISFSYVFEKS